ncbi:MAG: serine/threonine protein kinase, partial [Planctomycetota bacterium]
MSDDDERDEAFIGIEVEGELAKYRILKAIGAGGMGAVFLADTVGEDRKVAVKFLHKELSGADDSSRERFEREMKVLQDLKSFRGIVRYEDAGTVNNGQLFLVMEFVNAPTLDHIISENPNGLPQIRAIQIVVEILSVLEPIHHRRFVHRDLKPHNICVYDEPLAVRLLDFGLSKPYMEGLGYDKVTRKMQGKGAEIPGSPHYMAVEQFLRPKDIDARTDLYSCGIILYELLAGIPPFRGIYLQDILQQHQKSPPPPIDSCADGGALSYRLWAVLEKALSKKAESRYKDANEFKEALFDVLNILNKREKPKKKLDAKYRMIKKIGVGGNSEVFEVETKESGERFALKIARDGASDWDEETLMNEADRALKHENIVQIHEFGTFQGRPALAMELLEGGSLEDILEKLDGEGMAENVYYRTMIDICRGLHHAHQKNIVHRDVKPGNMLRNLEGRTKVCDFGIAKRFEQVGDEMQGGKNTTMAKGTAQYISPEQCDLQGRVDRRADIYCLGVMMYEMLAGKLPFTDGILIMQHLQTNPPPLFVKGEFRNPDALCKIVERAMHKKPECRYQSMKDLAQELVRVSKLEPQTKSHKAVVLQTLPDEYLDAKTTKGKTEGLTSIEPIQNGMSRNKVVAIIGAVVIAMVGLMMFINSKNKSEVDPTPIISADDATTEMTACLDLIKDSKFEEVGDYEFKALQPNSTQMGIIRDNLMGQLSSHLSPGPLTSEKVTESLRQSGRAIDAAQNLGFEADSLGGATLKLAADFCASAGRFSEKFGSEEAPEKSWIDWNTALEDDLNAKANSLAGGLASFRKDQWQSFVNAQKSSLATHNVGVLKTSLKDMGAKWDPTIEPRVLTLLQGADATKKAAYEVFGAWVLDQFANAESLEAVGRFIQEGALGAGGIDAKGFKAILGDIQSIEVKVGNIPAQSRQEAISFALVGARSATAIETRLAGFMKNTIGLDPNQWEVKAASIEANGFPFTLYPNVLIRGVAAILADPKSEEELKARMASLGDKKAQEQAATKEKECAKALFQLADLSLDDDEELTTKWIEAYKDYRFNRDVVWAQLEENEVKKLGGDKALATVDLFAAMRRLMDFNRQYEVSLSQTNTMFAVASAQAEKLKKKGNALILLGFAREFEILNPSVLSQLALDARKRLTSSLLKHEDAITANLLVGGKLNAVNAMWVVSEEPCLKVLCELAPSISELVTSGILEIKGSGTNEVSYEDDDQTLSVNGSPKDLYVGAKTGSGTTIPMSMSLTLHAPGIGIKNEKIKFQFEENQDFDFDAPEVVLTTTQSQDGSAELTIKVTDPALGKNAPALTVGGKDIVLVKRDAATFSAKVRLGSGIETATKDSDVVRVSVKDDYGNQQDKTDSAWTKQIVTCREALVVAEERRIGSTFNNDMRGKRSFSSPSLIAATEAIKKAANAYEAVLSYGAKDKNSAIRNVASQALSNARAWQGTGKSESDVKRLNVVYDQYFAALTRLESLLRMSNASGEKDRNWTRLANSAKTTASANSSSNSGKTTPIDTGPNYAAYKQDVTALGVTFHRFDVKGKPVWIANVEVSQGFAAQYDSEAVDRAKKAVRRVGRNGAEFSTDANKPLAPMSPN